MSKIGSKRRHREALADMKAEDSVVAYLAQRAPEVRAYVVAKAARRLLYYWETAREEMIRCGDPREVFLSHPRQITRYHGILNWIIESRASADPDAERHVMELLEHLPPDSAAWTAIKVAEYEHANT
jgi:hypothetical protein